MYFQALGIVSGQDEMASSSASARLIRSRTSGARESSFGCRSSLTASTRRPGMGTNRFMRWLSGLSLRKAGTSAHEGLDGSSSSKKSTTTLERLL